MKKIIIILGLLLIAGCKTDVVDSTPVAGENLILQLNGKVDSVKCTVGPLESTTNFDFNLSGYAKARITFDYKGNADSIYYSIGKGYPEPNLWRFKRIHINTSDELLTYDSTFNISTSTTGTFKKDLTVYYDSSYFVIKNLKIYGVN
ncbi:MAG: hypothetical protein J0M18_20045 [Ignavibacteria bacterium]|nr:hypothetical protein [Ignavibacteria bacterium]